MVDTIATSQRSPWRRSHSDHRPDTQLTVIIWCVRRVGCASTLQTPQALAQPCPPEKAEVTTGVACAVVHAGSIVVDSCIVRASGQGHQDGRWCVFGLLRCSGFGVRTRTKLICFLTEMLLESSRPIRGAAAGDARPGLPVDFFFFFPDFCNNSR